MNLLIIVNPQIDFCAGGALAIPGAAELLQRWHARLSAFDEVIALREWHPTDHVSFAQTHLWRKPGQKIEVDDKEIQLQISHCIADQFGAFFHPPFKEDNFSEIVNMGTNKAMETDEEVMEWFEGFWNKKLNGMDTLKITLCGLAHNSVFDTLKKGIDQKGIALRTKESEQLIYHEPQH